MHVGKNWGRWPFSPTSALGFFARRSSDLAKWEKLGDDFTRILVEMQTGPAPAECAEMWH